MPCTCARPRIQPTPYRVICAAAPMAKTLVLDGTDTIVRRHRVLHLIFLIILCVFLVYSLYSLGDNIAKSLYVAH